MGGEPSRRSWAHLLRLGSVPGTPAEVRAFLQRRMTVYLGFLTAFWLVAMTLATALTLASGPDWFRGQSAVRGVVQALAPIALFVLWRLARRGTRSLRWLAGIDTAAAIVHGAIFAGAILSALPIVRVRPDLVFILAATWALVARAVLVPSTTARTALIGALTTLPLCAAVLVMYRAAFSVPGFTPGPGATPVLYTAWAMFMSSLSVAISAYVSSVIFGLQRAVQHARQLGQYTLEEKIGEGGMGVVYKARHALLRRPTAVKLLPPDRAGAETVARFEREVQVTSQLTHPNTVAIYDYGRTPDDVFYYAMEYLDGVDLEELVRGDGPQPPARVSHFLRQAAGALAEAHTRGLIHRDVKPSNVVVCERGLIPDFVKVLDFGLARDHAAPGVNVTQAGQIAGTPLYMSPEQIRLQPLDGRSDLYALGALGYYLLTGTPVFSGASALEICGHHLHSPVQPPRERVGRPLPASLEALVLSCLEKAPDRRPADASAVVAALDAASDVPRWTDEDARRWWRQRGVSSGAAGV